MSGFPGAAQAAKQVTRSLLDQRKPRAPDLHIENQALLSLAQCLADAPRSLLTEMCELVMRLCGCESAGVTLLEHDETGEEMFFWPGKRELHGGATDTCGDSGEVPGNSESPPYSRGCCGAWLPACPLLKPYD